MSKLLVFLLVLFAIYWGRRLLSKPKRPAPERSRAQTQASTRMLSCRQCGVHVPESEGVRRGGQFYCCEEHARAGDAG